MIQYKNISFSAKTFYGVKFEPGEIKSVPGYINDNNMVRVFRKVKSKPVQNPDPVALFEEPQPIKIETRGRKKKSTEPERDSFAENTEIKISEITEEETSNGNPS